MQSLAWLVVWLPLLGFLFNAISGFLIRNRDRQKFVVAWVAPVAVLAAFVVAAFVVLPQVMSAPEHRMIVPLLPWGSAESPWIKFGGFQVNFALLLDPLSLLMTLIVTGVGGLIHIYATGYMAEDREQPRFFTYFNLFIFMMLLLVLGENFLLMFVGWEGVGTCSYLLISFWYTDVQNAKAGNKAFIVNRVGDLGFALGIMAIWSVFGTLSFFGQGEHAKGIMDLAKQHIDVNGNPLSQTSFTLPLLGTYSAVTMICILLFIGAMGKSAQIPLWVWLPDAMAGPTPVSALIHAATMVTSGVVMVTRCSWLFVQAPEAMQLVGWIGLATAFMGGTIALVQNDIKKVLAYSTVSQLGYMFLACGVGNFTAGMFHVTTHAFFKALLFLGAGAVIHSMHGEQDMRKMGGLKKLISRTWAVMFIGTYAIAGFPLMSGFFSKDEILHSASQSPFGNGMILYGVGLLTAFMTAFYMNRMMWKTFYTDPRFIDGQLEEHHHSNFDDEEDTAHGHDHAHTSDTQGLTPEEAQAAVAHATPLHGHGAHGSVHESPPSMMIPLYVLAVFAVLFGLLTGPNKAFEHFLEPSVAPLSLGPLALQEGPISENAGYFISSLIAIAGLSLAAFLYKQHMQTGDLVPREKKQDWERYPLGIPAIFYALFAGKWAFDWVYNLVFIKIGGWFADRILWRTVDAGVIDGTVNGVAGGVGRFSESLRRLQTGYVRNYALGMLIGAVILVASLLFTYTSNEPSSNSPVDSRAIKRIPSGEQGQPSIRQRGRPTEGTQ